MIRKRLDELQGNEVLARPLMTWDYQVVLPEGTVIRKDYIEKIVELGILEVYVREEQSSEIAILKSDMEDSIREKVKDILERHTYHNNQELEELSKTADNIISTILEEEQVVEKVFDIRERSADLYEHSINICALAILTALKLEIDRQTIHDIGVGCLLHDIGLRYTTLNFNEKNVESLNEQELAEFKKHPVYGYSTLKDENWISDVSKYIILYHHERLDGSGFPLHIKNIPLECRIVNVCDAFDEMICGIACRRTKVYEAVEYLKSFQNIKFDGKIVDIFLTFTAVYPAGSQVITNEGELAEVISQNKAFQDRPVIRILKDKDGKDVHGKKIIDLVKVHHVFIDKVLE
ncbi:MAG: HD domain-containing protein [Acetatifactor sp.]|nr:HD domain-containing protein [Acetatifactor sp.]